MNQVFSFDRWLLLVKKHWYENRKRYLLGSITVAGLMIVFFIIYIVLNGGSYFYSEEQAIFFFFGLFLVGCLYASVLFNDLASKSKGIAYLTIPASHLEKLLCGLFYGLILFTLVYSVVFYPVDAVAVKISNSERYQEWLIEKQMDTTMQDFRNAPVVNVLRSHEDREYDETNSKEREEPNYYFYFWMAFLGLQAFYALGSVYFGAYSFIKTTVTALALAAFFFLLFEVIHIFLYSNSDVNTRFYFSMANSYHDAVTFVYKIPDVITNTEIFILEFLFTPLFWLVAFLRLKEKEI